MFDQLSNWMGGALTLKQAAFQAIALAPSGLTIALIIILTAGFSQAVGQSIILFINRVSPSRFLFSLVLNAVLFACGFLFLVLSTWLLGWIPGFVPISWGALFRVWGLSYSPLLFSFLGALPYAGVPILSLLSVWRLLAMVVGFSAIAQISGAAAFTHVALGWFILQILEGSVGQPIAKVGQHLSEWVAGVDLADNQAELLEMIESGVEQFTQSFHAETSRNLTPLEDRLQALTQPIGPTSPSMMLTDFSNENPNIVHLTKSSSLRTRLRQRLPKRQETRLVLATFGMVALFVLLALLLLPIRDALMGWHDGLPRLVRWSFDLIWISIVAVAFAGLLAPLEALGWWAGWYSDEVNTQSIAVAPALSSNSQQDVSRYVVYLDGVGQSGEAYTPDVEAFVQALQAALPPDMVFISGLMMYSVFNRPLNEDRPLAWLWQQADKMRLQNPAALLGMLLNLRNMIIVAVSADKRYGPIYNQGIAQVLYNGLLRRGYQPGEGIPLTLIGYSGGGEMSVAAAPYLRRALGAEIEVISLGGVLSAKNNFLKLEHLYHLVGDKDGVATMGPVFFPGRTPLFPLSYWNRALRKGKISQISLGPMGHQVPGGIMDPQAFLPNGQSHLQHTISVILAILEGQLLVAKPPHPQATSNYEVYKQAAFNDYRYYPLEQTVDLQLYQPIAPWMGRLILPQPTERRQVRGVWFEVHHAARGHEALVGQRVMLRWVNEPSVKRRIRAVARDVHFSVDAEYSSEYEGSIHPERLNHWQRVGPLESLAGSHPVDDLIVMLSGLVQIEEGSQSTAQPPILHIDRQPVEITGRYYGLVQFTGPSANPEYFQVRHYNPVARRFNGATETVALPQVVFAKAYGSYPSTTDDLEQSPLNQDGWYIYGAKDRAGTFVVQALAPRALFRLQPERVVFGERASYQYIRQEAWADAVAQKGSISSVLCVSDVSVSNVSNAQTPTPQAAVEQWQPGDRALVLHVYGGIGGQNKEPAAATPIFFGHFAYGLATVVQDPLSDELRFDIQYYQVYSHNTDGLTAGTLHWSRYMGDRQFGWLGSRPTCDILVKFEPFTDPLNIHGVRRSALSQMLHQLQTMTARYRIGDGTGATYVGPANNCSQDSNQALFASIRDIERAISTNQAVLQTWREENPDQEQRYWQLLDLGKKLRRELQPFGAPRSDWETNEFNLGTTLEDAPLQNLWTGLGSWRTLLPRKASDTIVRVFLKQGAMAWVLRTNQVGGYDPNIEPIIPNTL